MKNEILINEYVLRKQQILNLEVRIFILLFVLEIVFVLFYAFKPSFSIEKKFYYLIGLCVYFILLFEMISINGKMGLISTYLKQMEQYLTSLGYNGAVWESKALGSIIFSKFNAFTFSAILVVLLLTIQTIVITYLTVCELFPQRIWRLLITSLIGMFLFFLLIKSYTVDFNKKYPTVFPTTSQNLKE